MKASVLGLAISTLALGATSIYLWRQLESERTRSAEVADMTRRLNERIVELEVGRTGFPAHGPASVRVDMSGRGPAKGGAVLPATPAGGAAKAEAEAVEQVAFSGLRPDQSPAFRKMMRSQMRASNKRLYAGVGAELGLTEGEADELIDLLTEQQLAGFDQMHDATDPAEASRRYEQARREEQAAVNDLIGADRAVSLQEYQETLPARQDFEMLARQLEDHDVALSADQRKQLLSAYVEERTRVPMPEYVEGTDGAEYARSVNAWQDDYNRRVSGEAENILSADQLSTYNEIQQWQKEMREQFAVIAPNNLRLMRGGGIARGNVAFTAAVPAMAVSGPVNVVTPAPDLDK
jgi:hypothetical protein